MAQSEEELQQAIQERAMELLRANGIPCYTEKDLVTPELEEAFKGWG
ncbi:hypothetical protein LCGC14_0387420 [marine sediment metagenome]|uniref:Uncharacterized protein n=1 Tax=marine sediment metagenome TaxID=412755 RepID=A0A0F9T0F7_9ZZZZ